MSQRVGDSKAALAPVPAAQEAMEPHHCMPTAGGDTAVQQRGCFGALTSGFGFNSV